MIREALRTARELISFGLFLAAGALILTIYIAAASGDGSLFVEVQQ